MNPKHRAISSVVFGSVLLLGCTRSAHRSAIPHVRIAATLGTFGHLPTLLANSLGYFQQEGIEAEILTMAGSSKVMEALLGGSADIGAGSLEQSIQMAAEAHPVQAFVTEFFNFGFLIAVSPRTYRQIRTLGDLNGASIGVTSLGSQSHFLVNFLLSRNGIPTREFSAVGIGLGASNLSAIEQGRVDAGITTPNVLMLLQKRHPGTLVLFNPLPVDTFEKTFGVQRYPSHVLYAPLDWIQRNKPIVSRVASAVKRALKYIDANPAETIVSKVPVQYRSPDPALDIAALKTWKPLYSRDGQTPPSSFEAVRTLTGLSLDKLRSTTIDPEKVYTNEFLRQTQ